MLAKDIRTFVRAGRATFTLQSVATGRHLTYRVVRANGAANRPVAYFVCVLVAPDTWAYLGTAIWHEQTLRGSVHSKMHRASDAWRGFEWFMRELERRAADQPLRGCIFRHEGRCGRCMRELTHPDSIDSGIGPECAAKLGISRENIRGPKDAALCAPIPRREAGAIGPRSLQQMLAERRAEQAGETDRNNDFTDLGTAS